MHDCVRKALSTAPNQDPVTLNTYQPSFVGTTLMCVCTSTFLLGAKFTKLLYMVLLSVNPRIVQ